MNATTNFKRLLLYIITCLVLIWSNVYAGSLIGLVLFFQMSLGWSNITFNKQSQKAAFYLFLLSAPLFLFISGVHSFFNIYTTEQQWIFAAMTLAIIIPCLFLLSLQSLFIFDFIELEHFAIAKAYDLAWNNIKKNKLKIFKQTAFSFLCSLIPWLSSDWKILFGLSCSALLTNQLYQKNNPLKTTGMNQNPH